MQLTSRDSFFMNGAETLCILSPTAVLPVNEMTEMFGCLTIASPARGPTPNTRLHTPGGRPRGGGGADGEGICWNKNERLSYCPEALGIHRPKIKGGHLYMYVQRSYLNIHGEIHQIIGSSKMGGGRLHGIGCLLGTTR